MLTAFPPQRRGRGRARGGPDRPPRAGRPQACPHRAAPVTGTQPAAAAHAGGNRQARPRRRSTMPCGSRPATTMPALAVTVRRSPPRQPSDLRRPGLHCSRRSAARRPRLPPRQCGARPGGRGRPSGTHKSVPLHAHGQAIRRLHRKHRFGNRHPEVGTLHATLRNRPSHGATRTLPPFWRARRRWCGRLHTPCSQTAWGALDSARAVPRSHGSGAAATRWPSGAPCSETRVPGRRATCWAAARCS